jgi:hypothetical protein
MNVDIVIWSFNVAFKSRIRKGNSTIKGVLSKASNFKKSKTLCVTFFNIDITAAGLVPAIKEENTKARNIDFTSNIIIVKKVRKIRLKTRKTTESHNVCKER